MCHHQLTTLFPPASILLLLLPFLILPLIVSACTLHAHCDDRDLATIDFCLPSTLCLHLPNPNFPPSNPYHTQRQHQYHHHHNQQPHSHQTPFLSRQQSTVVTLLNRTTLLQQADQPALPLSARLQIISIANDIYTNVSPHRFLQLSRYKLNITAAFANFAASPHLPALSNTQFHQRIIALVNLMSDGHSRYFLPPPLAATVATLGFNVAPYYTPASSTPVYVVNSVALGLNFSAPTFGPGARLLRWNRLPIATAIRALSRRLPASNPPARRAFALLALTVRQLAEDPLPQQSAVTIHFIGTDGNLAHVVVPWLYLGVRDFSVLQFAMNPRGIPLVSRTAAPHQRTDPSLRGAVPWARATLLAMASVRLPLGARQDIPVASTVLGPSFRAEIIRTSQGRIGRLVIPDFASDFFGGLVPELTRLLRLMPRRGLIIDLRDNRGGNPNFAKTLTELTTGGQVDPQPTVIRANELLRRIVFSPLASPSSWTRQMALLISVPYRTALRTALRAGERFSGPSRNLYDLAAETVQERVYFGPVVTLVNGRTFSGGDLFAAIQKDKGLSTIVGTDANVAAGGAVGLSYRTMSLTFNRVLKPLPGAIDFTMSFARFYRTGRNAGGIIESFGVKPDVRYFPSRADVLNNDFDLMEFLGKGLVEGFKEARRRRR